MIVPRNRTQQTYNQQEILQMRAFRDQFVAMMVLFNAMIHKLFKGQLPPIDCSKVKQANDDTLRNWLMGIEYHKPIIYDNQIITVAKVLSKWLEHPNKHIGLLGALQAGKTMVLIFLHKVLPLYQWALGMKTMPYLWCPNFDDIEHQIWTDEYAFSRLFNYCSVNGFTTSSYMTDVLGIHNFNSRDYINKVNTSTVLKYEARVMSLTQQHPELQINSHYDEGQDGNDLKSLKDRMVTFTNRKQRNVEISATLSEYMAIEGQALYEVVAMTLAKGHVGPMKYKGISMDTMPGFVERWPTIKHHQDFLKTRKCVVNLNHEGFTDAINDGENDGAEEAIETFLQDLVRAVLAITSDSPCLTISAGSKVKYAEAIVARLRGALPNNFKIIEFYDNPKKRHPELEQHLMASIAEKMMLAGNIVIIVTVQKDGKGVRFPHVPASLASKFGGKRRRYFLYFHDGKTKWDAQLQQFGRACGMHDSDEEPIILSTANYVAEMTTYLTDGCSDLHHIKNQSLRTGFTKAGERPTTNITVTFEKPKSAVEKALSKILTETKESPAGSSKVRLSNGKFRNESIREILNYETVTALTNGLQMANYGERLDVMHTVASGDDNIGMRSASSPNQHQQGSSKGAISNKWTNGVFTPELIVGAKDTPCPKCNKNLKSLYDLYVVPVGSKFPHPEEVAIREQRLSLFKDIEPRGLKKFKIEHACCFAALEIVPLTYITVKTFREVLGGGRGTENRPDEFLKGRSGIMNREFDPIFDVSE